MKNLGNAGKNMKKNSKEKYDSLKPDGKAYEELVSEYEREQMPDYSFKNRSQAMGKNAKKLGRNKILRTALSIFGAILLIYIGYFIIAVIKGVNSREQTTTAQYVEVYEPESTTVPETTQQDASVPASTEPAQLPNEDSDL